MDHFIDAATVKALSRIKPSRGILQIALEWLGIAAAIILCQSYWHPGRVESKNSTAILDCLKSFTTPGALCFE